MSINDLLFSFFKAKHADKAGSKRVDSIKALKTYMEQSHLNQDPLEFWKNFTDETVGLQQIARHCLFIPATSRESEPMFSKAADIVSAKRTLLKTSNVDNILTGDFIVGGMKEEEKLAFEQSCRCDLQHSW
ncbi:uncharacterized protein LOC111077098 [Drosophila obscura]|uniref:uncharacterized protein LOC111077098 n=1 Tax=Drosophila obscura TaxID=7282 RepID=UPI001BB1391B|nr:uncharacterized protein LOC111077098 [Drosophila obscura]